MIGFREGGDGCGQNAAKQVQFTNKLVQSVTLLPTPMTVFPRVALDSHFDIVQVFRLEEIAYFVENHRDMVGKLFIRERIAMFDVGITERGFYPTFGQHFPLVAQCRCKSLQGANGCIGHHLSLRCVFMGGRRHRQFIP